MDSEFARPCYAHPELIAVGCNLHAEEADGDGTDALDDEGHPQLGRVRRVRRDEVPARCRRLGAAQAKEYCVSWCAARKFYGVGLGFIPLPIGWYEYDMGEGFVDSSANDSGKEQGGVIENFRDEHKRKHGP